MIKKDESSEEIVLGGKVHLEDSLSNISSLKELEYGLKVFQDEEGETPIPCGPKFTNLLKTIEP